MIKEKEIQALNQKLRNASPKAIIEVALNVNAKSVITTNFRPYEAAILHAVSNVDSEISVIWCDTGYNTRQTYKHANELIENLKLNVSLYVPKQTTAHRDVTMGIPNIDDPMHKEFTEQVKLEPFRRAMNTHQPNIWFTNLRKGQTAFRDSIDIFSLGSDGILKVSPFYHWSDNDLDVYLEEHNLPNEFKYFDPTKVLDNRECGIHA
ncbi:phosphoadenylylsulfate reductase [Flavobacteriaceae bacterium AU392]|nr:phosphoadenylylsulfate reductase [Flavobacteriaceae bacterium]RKM81671.1 phosphoadenylylsulfate reductase [Flavobacteriaceae bacterium AU392]